MIEVFRRRFSLNKARTVGDLTIDGDFVCHTLEDRVRPDGEKVYGETAIPCGDYSLEGRKYGKLYNYANKHWGHDWIFAIDGVPNFTDILFHWGNSEKDTEGCILLGSALGDLDGPVPLIGSRKAYKVFYEKALAETEVSIIGSEEWFQ